MAQPTPRGLPPEEKSACSEEERAAKAAEEGRPEREDFERLRAEHQELKADVAALLRCLQRQGVLSEDDWRSARSEGEKCPAEEGERQEGSSASWSGSEEEPERKEGGSEEEPERKEGCGASAATLQMCLEPAAATSRAAAFAGQGASGVLGCVSKSLRTSLDAVREESLLVVGGYAFSWSKDGEASMKSGESFDARTGRSYAVAASVGKYLYVCGGDQPHPEGILDTVERFEPSEDKGGKGAWMDLPPMASKRSAAAGAAFRGHVFVCGGVGEGGGVGHMPKVLDSAEMFSPLKDSWQKLPNLNCSRTAHAVTVLRGKVYATGGDMSNTGAPRASMEVYDWDAGAWSLCAEMMSGLRSAHGAAALAGSLYVFGGHTEPRPYPSQEPACSSVERYDPETGTWESVQSMSQARGHFCAVVVRRVSPQQHSQQQLLRARSMKTSSTEGSPRARSQTTRWARSWTR